MQTLDGLRCRVLDGVGNPNEPRRFPVDHHEHHRLPVDAHLLGTLDQHAEIDP